MSEIKLGHHYKARPLFTALAEQTGGVVHTGCSAIKPKAATEKCVFIHPTGQFVTLEFPVRGEFSGSASGRVRSHELRENIPEHPGTHLRSLREVQEGRDL